MQVNLGQNCMKQAYYPRHKFLGQAQASPKVKGAHLVAAHERETQPTCMTRHRSKAIPPRPIRRVHKDLRGHQSTKTDSRQAMTHMHNMRAHLAAFRPRTGPNGLSQGRLTSRSSDLVVTAHGPHRLSDDMWRGVDDPQRRFGSFLGYEAGGSLL